ncbi:MAG: 2-oxoacid:acceptor oxidoreductase family protein, partial [Gammaproteobacteria bacterium]|nr:2-oxoacid:acceptor oxidoreductase family protein [Gammaproteobacteria bacterium]
MQKNNWSVAITGSGGSGSVTAGLILLEAIAMKGLYGVMTRSYGPQIRGGESAVMIRFGTQEVQSQSDHFDVLLSLDWLKVERFAEEIPLTADSVIIGEAAAGEVPAVLSASGAQTRLVDMAGQVSSVEGGRANMLALGILGAWIGLSAEQLLVSLDKVLGKKSAGVREASRTCIIQGLQAGESLLESLALTDREIAVKRWNISGNEGSACGALIGGVRFVAAYPITPASDLLEWLAPRLEKVGGSLLQAEDELASINMVIGGSFGGVPSLTATSGPGLSLMAEAIGLAVASEIPLVVVNVNRGGPSTGIPTKSEQSDLNIALYGLHGDAPHLVLAPLNIKDCVATTQWAVALAETLQVPAIVLTDQMMAQARVIVDAPDLSFDPVTRLRAEQGDEPYHRYKLLESGISPMSAPGDAGLQYTADGLEHNENGTPSSLASDHLKQSHK